MIMIFGLSRYYKKKIQSDGDLGQMHDAFETLLKWGIKTALCWRPI
jgi:hypothetical protein